MAQQVVTVWKGLGRIRIPWLVAGQDVSEGYIGNACLFHKYRHDSAYQHVDPHRTLPLKLNALE